ncbi:DegT/DnrJ/EryC1/StrS aminotransferase family protein [Candidatus Saccharibacteria bacterium]|nr:DegT/DnrJ/EryC1/StrS aminotransferase family protein [Candidatus Saccharibacteria bacterium]
MIFLGLASNYTARRTWHHAFALGNKKDYDSLEQELSRRYNANIDQLSLAFSGRSAIYLALESFIESGKMNKGDHVAINSFTCHAVLEAIERAGLEPVYVDLEKTISGQILPNYSADALEEIAKKDKKLKCFILQNTFGFAVDIRRFEKVKKNNNLLLLEDLAHCTGRKYPDGREIGTVGEATCLSFGKGKSIDTIIGGAVVLRDSSLKLPEEFDKNTLRHRKGGDVPRASWYPVFGAIARGLAHVYLDKPWLGLLLKLRWIERSADTKLLVDTSIAYWQARLALEQFNSLKNTALREFFLVDNRDACLKELRRHGYRLEESWYEVPVAPERYYKSVHFPEKQNPNAVFFAQHVINLPTWYHSNRKKKQVAKAKKIIKLHELKGGR